MKHRKLINIAGNILMLLSFAFIVNRIIEYGVDFSKITSIRTFFVLMGSVILYALLVIAFAFIFYLVLKMFSNNNISKKDSIFIYCKSNLYKYLPGNIFHYIGRNEVAFNNGVSHGVVIAATIAEIILIAISAVITAIIFAGQYAIKWATDNYATEEVVVFVALLILILLAGVVLYKLNSEKISAEYIRLTNNIRLSDAIIFIMVYMISFILNGVMFILVLYSLGGVLSVSLLLPVIGMYTLSWLIGFITPGAPAGLGIREAIMSALLFDIVAAEFVISAVVLYRIITILGDVVSFLIVFQLSRQGILSDPVERC